STMSGSIGGAGGLTKTGAGTLNLSGAAANTYTGATTVQAGTLSLGKTAGVDAISTGGLIVGGFASPATVNYNASEQIANASSLLVGSQGTLNLNGFNETIAQASLLPAAFVNIGTGTLTINNAMQINGIVNSSGAGSLVLNGNLSTSGNPNQGFISGSVNLGGGTRTFTVVSGRG